MNGMPVSIRADASELLEVVTENSKKYKVTVVSIRADASELLEGFQRILQQLLAIKSFNSR